MTKPLVLLLLNCAVLLSAQDIQYYPYLDPSGFTGEEDIVLEPLDNTITSYVNPPLVPNVNYPPGYFVPESHLPGDYYEDVDINGNLISITTNGFQNIESKIAMGPICPPGWPCAGDSKPPVKVMPQVFTKNNSYSSPFESVHRRDLQTKNQTTTIITHTIIRPKQKPKTIIEIFKDPSQSGENITLTDPENNIFEFNTSLVNVYTTSERATVETTEITQNQGLWGLLSQDTTTTEATMDVDLEAEGINTITEAAATNIVPEKDNRSDEYDEDDEDDEEGNVQEDQNLAPDVSNFLWTKDSNKETTTNPLIIPTKATTLPPIPMVRNPYFNNYKKQVRQTTSEASIPTTVRPWQFFG